jgi:hypothetical protein
MDKVQRHITVLGNEIKRILHEAIELSYFSRGAWPYETVLNMTAGERDIASSFINKRLEVEAKRTTPVY